LNKQRGWVADWQSGGDTSCLFVLIGLAMPGQKDTILSEKGGRRSLREKKKREWKGCDCEKEVTLVRLWRQRGRIARRQLNGHTLCGGGPNNSGMAGLPISGRKRGREEKKGWG